MLFLTLFSLNMFESNNSPACCFCFFFVLYIPTWLQSAPVDYSDSLCLSPYMSFPTCGNNLGSYPKMSQWNPAILKTNVNVVFQAVGLIQNKKTKLLHKLLGEGVQPVHLVEVWNIFAKSFSLRNNHCLVEDHLEFICLERDIWCWFREDLQEHSEGQDCIFGILQFWYCYGFTETNKQTNKSNQMSA